MLFKSTVPLYTPFNNVGHWGIVFFFPLQYFWWVLSIITLQFSLAFAWQMIILSTFSDVCRYLLLGTTCSDLFVLFQKSDSLSFSYWVVRSSSYIPLINSLSVICMASIFSHLWFAFSLFMVSSRSEWSSAYQCFSLMVNNFFFFFIFVFFFVVVFVFIFIFDYPQTMKIVT